MVPMKRKGIAFIESLVVIAVLAVIVGAVVLFAGRLRSNSQISQCQSNLKSLGQAMTNYASDYKGKYPVSGGPNAFWAQHLGWKYEADLPPYKLPEYDGKPVAARVTSSWYLLVKYAEVVPSQFTCDSSSDTAFSYSPLYRHYRQLWDFGEDPYQHCSYSLQLPYGKYPASSHDKPDKPIAADKSPWFDKDGQILPSAPYNSRNHNGKGQNILTGGLNVIFSKTSTAGIDSDEIYTYSHDNIPPAKRDAKTDSQDADDSFLVM